MKLILNVQQVKQAVVDYVNGDNFPISVDIKPEDVEVNVKMTGEFDCQEAEFSGVVINLEQATERARPKGG